MSNRTCPKCGAAVAEKVKFCGECGAPVPLVAPVPAPAKASADEPFLKTPPPAPRKADAPAGQGGSLVWQTEMTMLGNKFFWRDFLKWISISTLLAGGLLFAIFCGGGGAKGAPAAFYITLIGVGLMTFSTLLFILIMGNRIPVEFTMDEDGINMKTTSKRMKGINRAAMVLGVLARKPGAVGAGAIGRSQESITILWKELKVVKWFPEDRVIFLRGDIFSRIRVYCTPENYAQVEKRIRERQPSQPG